EAGAGSAAWTLTDIAKPRPSASAPVAISSFPRDSFIILSPSAADKNGPRHRARWRSPGKDHFKAQSRLFAQNFFETPKMNMRPRVKPLAKPFSFGWFRRR